MAENLWPNADLETGIDDWTLATRAHSDTKAQEQTYSLQWHGAGADQNVTSVNKEIISASAQYTASLYVNPDVEVAINFFIRDQDANWVADGDGIPVTCPADQWTRLTCTGTMAGDDTGITLRVEKNNDVTDEMIYVDAVMLETGDTASAWENYSSSSPGALTKMESHPYPALGGSVIGASSRLVMPQDNDSAVHAAKFMAIVRGIQVPASGNFELSMAGT